MPVWALALAYWLHLLATVIWIGGQSTLAWLVIPAARRTLPAGSYEVFLRALQERLQQIAWFSLALLAGSGMFQMSAHPAYHGFLSIDSSWATAMLLKHLAVGAMLVLSAYLTWGLLPALQRLALAEAAGKAGNPRLQGTLAVRQQRALVLNQILSAVVLALTAWARSS